MIYSPEKEKSILERIEKLGISKKDIVEKFVRSSGKGGQNVNKVSTCVYLKHIPTGIEVKIQQERSQHANRLLAREALVEKLEAITLERKRRRQQEVEKNRRQKRKRSKRAKEKILENKKFQSKKKISRRSVSSRDHHD